MSPEQLSAERPAKMALLTGAMVMAFSVVLSWVRVRPLGDLNLVQVIPAAGTLGMHDGQLLPWVTLSLAGAAAAVACLTVRPARVLHLIVGAVSLAWIAYLKGTLDHLGAGPLGFSAAGPGPWVALVGALSMFGSGLVPPTDHRRSEAGSSAARSRQLPF